MIVCEQTETVPFDPEKIACFVYWVREREAIRIAKEAGRPKPWTMDPLFQTYRWCCVKRMDDLVSRRLVEEWYDPDADAETMLVAATLARLVNWPDSLLEATDGARFALLHLRDARQRLKARAATGAKIFTGAYVVPGVPGKEKIDSVIDLVEHVQSNAKSILKPTLRGTWEGLVEVKGMGSFLAGQAVADMAQHDCCAHWHDRWTWAPLGPGSARGMNRLLGRRKDHPIKQAEFDVLLSRLVAFVSPMIDDICADRRLCFADWQSLCCETDKMSRLLAGEGTVRARYDGGPGNSIGEVAAADRQRSLF